MMGVLEEAVKSAEDRTKSVVGDNPGPQPKDTLPLMFSGTDIDPDELDTYLRAIQHEYILGMLEMTSPTTLLNGVLINAILVGYFVGSNQP